MTTFMPLLTIMLVRFILIIVKIMGDGEQKKYYKPMKRGYKMNLRFRRKINSLNMLFNGHYLDAKALYVLQTGRIPCIRFIGEIDGAKAFEYIKENFAGDIKHEYHHSYFDHDKKESLYNTIILIMPNQRMMELSSNHCHIFHHTYDFEWAANMCKIIAGFRNVTNTTATTQIVGFARQPEIINN
jgi:hypothetical protein